VVGVLAQNREHLVELTKKVGIVAGIRQLDCSLALDIRKFDGSPRRASDDGFPRILDTVPNVPGFDALDSMIILALRKDGRSSNYHLAKELGISEGAVRHRIKRLLGRNAIQILPVLRHTDMPSAIAYVGIRADRRSLDHIANELKSFPNIPFITETVGQFDIILLTSANERTELLTMLLDNVRTIAGVRKTETLELINLIKWDFDWMRILDSNVQCDTTDDLPDQS
jgi:Lrp/AsnC family transcriptional regulator for asnA, asnC and gidA